MTVDLNLDDLAIAVGAAAVVICVVLLSMRNR